MKKIQNNKMNTITLLVFTCIISVNTFAQIDFQDYIISTNVNGAHSVFATDIDSDGDMDIISASLLDDGVAWHENIDGEGNFGSQHIITSNADGAGSVFSTDVDGDGDMDILSASLFDDKIAWYENIDGEGNFDSQKIITTNAVGANSVFSIDIDGDGDMDVLSTSWNDNKVAWYENIDGEGNFGSQHIISSSADGAESVYSIDIDGDGDMDVLSASSTDSKIAWYENTDGQGNFGLQQIISSNADGAKSVYAIDIDGDEDIDVLSASWNDSKITWYKNTDGQGSYNGGQIISTSADGADSVYATDIDGDGDMDVLSASWLDNKIAWYENIDGLGEFGTQQIITSNARGAVTVYATDIDGDGNMDVLSASQSDDKIAWYKNLGVLSINENTSIDISIFPNPVKDFLNILNQNNNPIDSIQAYDILGRLVLEKKEYNVNQLDVYKLNRGVLFVKIKTAKGVVIKKIIKE